MVRYQVKKVVAVCFLDATKLVLDQLGQYRMEMSQRGTDGSREVTQLYGDIRRLRDYLQRCVGAFPEVVELDFGPDEQRLLVATCRRGVEDLDGRIELSRPGGNQEMEWLQRKRQVLGDWAFELAQKPLLQLPLPRLHNTTTNGTRALNVRLQQKIFGNAGPGGGGASGFEGFMPGNSLQQLKTVPGYVATRGADEVPAGGAPPHAGGPAAAAPAAGAHAASQPPPWMAPPPAIPIQATGGGGAAPSGLPPAEHGHEQPVPPGLVAGGVGAGFARLDADLGAMAAAHLHSDVRETLLDARQMHDQRLRALMVLDLRAWDRALEAQDHRLAAVHLASILEGVVLDHALPRRTELGLAGAPDSWNPQEILLRVLGEQCTPKDRSLVYHVFAARNLIRPTAQLVSPTVVTASSLAKLTEFALRAIRGMGFHTRPQDGIGERQAPASGPSAPF